MRASNQQEPVMKRVQIKLDRSFSGGTEMIEAKASDGQRGSSEESSDNPDSAINLPNQVYLISSRGLLSPKS